MKTRIRRPRAIVIKLPPVRSQGRPLPRKRHCDPKAKAAQSREQRSNPNGPAQSLMVSAFGAGSWWDHTPPPGVGHPPPSPPRSRWTASPNSWRDRAAAGGAARD